MLGRNLTSLMWMIFCLRFDSWAFFFCWYRNLPKSMMRQTGGLAVGATSTRSSNCSWARRNASSTGTMPACEPSASTSRTSRTLILSLIRVVLSIFSSPPRERRAQGLGGCQSKLQTAPVHEIANPRRELRRRHRAEVLAGAPAHRHRAGLLLARADHQHVGDLLHLRFADLVGALLGALVG